MNTSFDPEKIPLRKLIIARNKFRIFEWDESIGLSKPKGYDELPMISKGWLRKRNKMDEIIYAKRLLEQAVDKRKTLLIEQRLEELDDLRFMRDDSNEQISNSNKSSE